MVIVITGIPWRTTWKYAERAWRHGDPAVDVIAAWSVFSEEGRDAFRRALDVDDVTWLRGRGVALHQALLIIPYYPDTNPAFVAMALRTIDQVLAEHALGD